MIRYACLLVLVAGVARADVWQSALGSDLQRDNYNHQLDAGDDFVAQASSRQVQSRANIKALVKKAVEAYRLAAEAEPKEAEPYFRIVDTLYSFYFDCRMSALPTHSPLCSAAIDVARAEETLTAWDEAEKRAPLDPRFTSVRGEASIFLRALLHTHLATKPHLEAAARDYEMILARSGSGDINESVPANLAETYMMLGRVDEAIDMYREAQLHSTQSSTAFGLAVALDRDERGAEALDLVRAQGVQARIQFRDSYLSGLTFFVPSGEEAYYFALLAEAWGEDELAVEEWQRYIKSGAHPQFQPRARKHISVLQAQPKSQTFTDPGTRGYEPLPRP